MKWYLLVIKKYAVFSGRASRSEYWFFVLFNVMITIILAIIDAAMKIAFLQAIYSLAVLVPSVAVAVRRMHDVNKSGWYILIPIYNLILACTGGTAGDNKYGPDPLRPEFDTFLEPSPTNN
jgi:uncharacterized membrane protein YhaH (DUF805 family)